MSKPKTYLLNCGRDNDRIWILEQIEIEAKKRGLSTAEIIWKCISRGYEISEKGSPVNSSTTDEKNLLHDSRNIVKAWNEYEIRKVAEMYFNLLEKQIGNISFNKSLQIRFLTSLSLPNRSTGAVEFKCMNISAILKEDELPFLINFKPLHHYQKLLREIVVESFIPISSVGPKYKTKKPHPKVLPPTSKNIKKKYYAVLHGEKIGVFNNWDETQKLVRGFPGNIFKSFDSKQDAESYLEKNLIEIIQDLSKNNEENTISDVAKITGLSAEKIKYKNEKINLGLKKGYSKEYSQKIVFWKERRKKIKEFIIANPNSTVRMVANKTKANRATVIDEARKNGLEDILDIGEVKSNKMREKIELKEKKIKSFLLENPGTTAKIVANATGTSLARIYALAQKEKLPLGKVKNQPHTLGQINKEKIRTLYEKYPTASIKEIAHKTELSEPTVSKHAKALGITPRRKKLKGNKRNLSPKYSRLIGA